MSIAYERKRTRDLLLSYNKSIMPLVPHSAGLRVVYPWEDLSSTYLLNQLYNLAIDSGYMGTQEEFNNNFGSFLQDKEIYYNTFENFPTIGKVNQLYFDLNEKILYYWNNEYIPVNAMLIANTIINGGEA